MKVTKYSGSGNDFIIFIAQNRENRGELAKKLCHRQNGVGADGMVVVVPNKEYDFEWEFYNSDGSEAFMCGNASRCVAHFAHEKGISKENKSEFLTKAGVIRASINGIYVVSDMVTPKFITKEVDAYNQKCWIIDTGVPHLVAQVDKIDKFSIEEARKLREKYNCNVNIYTIKNNILFVRTYERGVENETLACGTGMVACFIRAFKEEKVTSQVKVYPKSQDEIYVSYEDGIYRFGGKVIKTFEANTFV